MMPNLRRSRTTVLTLGALWLVLTAERCPAPRPNGDYPDGVNGIPRGLSNALTDMKAVGFDGVRTFIHWHGIQPTNDPLDTPAKVQAAFTCRYVVDSDKDDNGNFWEACNPAQGDCHAADACGKSADERLGEAVDPLKMPTVVTVVGTPAWAGGPKDGGKCPGSVPFWALPIKSAADSCPSAANAHRTCVDAWNEFVYVMADRYAPGAYAFELWNEPDKCESWAGSAQQYKARVLPAAQQIKNTGAIPGIVVAPGVSNSARVGDYTSFAYPLDYVSFHAYGALSSVQAQIDAVNSWCDANVNCTGFYITEFGYASNAQSGGGCIASTAVADPGPKAVSVMNYCFDRGWCWGTFHYTLSDRTKKPHCDMGLLDENGCRKGRLCQIASDWFGTNPFTCAGCGD